MPPLKSDEARTDFYNVYKRESIEHDTNYVKKYEEDLNTTLVFVRPTIALSLETLMGFLGWIIFSCQFFVCHRYPDETGTRSERYD
jgi:hypothetical protein